MSLESLRKDLALVQRFEMESFDRLRTYVATVTVPLSDHERRLLEVMWSTVNSCRQLVADVRREIRLLE